MQVPLSLILFYFLAHKSERKNARQVEAGPSWAEFESIINFALNDIIVTRAAATQCAPPLIRGMWASGVCSTIFGWNEEVGEGYTREFQTMVGHAVRQEVEPLLFLFCCCDCQVLLNAYRSLPSRHHPTPMSSMKLARSLKSLQPKANTSNPTWTLQTQREHLKPNAVTRVRESPAPALCSQTRPIGQSFPVYVWNCVLAYLNNSRVDLSDRRRRQV